MAKPKEAYLVSVASPGVLRHFLSCFSSTSRQDPEGGPLVLLGSQAAKHDDAVPAH